MEELVSQMKVVLASTFALYLKSQYFHWNVEGRDFYQYHKLFQKAYETIYDFVDSDAEHIRALNSYSPGSLTRFKELSIIEDQLNIPAAREMISILLSDNEKLINSLELTYRLAEQNNSCGLSNYLQDRIDQHQKLSWMLRATTKD